MKNKILISLSLLILASCAHKMPEQHVPEAVFPKRNEKAIQAIGKTRGIFHIISPLSVELILKRVGDKNEENVLMDKTLSQLGLEPGHWQVKGFILGGKTYRIMRTSKRFIFDLKKDQATYVGSYIIQCPKVNKIHFEEMKKMSFFNRYPFSSKYGLCEMVAGSNYDVVNKVWLELSKEHRPLSLGF